MSTVLMIDISHGMILYGEDRITPAKKVAMALAGLANKNPKDTLDIIVFEMKPKLLSKDLPCSRSIPSIQLRIQLAMDILKRKKK